MTLRSIVIDSKTDQTLADECWLYLEERGSRAWLDKLKRLVAAGTVSVEFNDIDLKNEEWDCEIRVKYTQEPSAISVVNDLLWNCYADEKTMNDSKTVRLWWD